MVYKTLTAALIFLFTVSAAAFCQELDGSPYDPAKDPDIDLFMASWKDSNPRHSHGSLIERDILTKGNQLNPPRKGAVLEYINRFVHATLYAHTTTAPTMLKGEQEAFYIISGKGTITGGGKTYDLYEGICFLVPENLKFIMTNTGDEPLTMYLICEPVQPGFTPRKDIFVKSEAETPFNSGVGHWSYQEKDLLVHANGFSTLHAVITLTLDPMTIGHPHVHVKGCEEVWTTVYGDNIAWLGKQIRFQPPGTAYMIPPDGKTNHSNINQSKTDQVKMLYFSVRDDIQK
ncbi:cupin domain-containing protein [bacterium]|nr:cupin domain-containing protein [bacterium]